MEVFFIILSLLWSVLCIVLFFKIWGMTNDVRAMRDALNETYGLAALRAIGHPLDSAGHIAQSDLLEIDTPQDISEGDWCVLRENMDRWHRVVYRKGSGIQLEYKDALTGDFVSTDRLYYPEELLKLKSLEGTSPAK